MPCPQTLTTLPLDQSESMNTSKKFKKGRLSSKEIIRNLCNIKPTIISWLKTNWSWESKLWGWCPTKNIPTNRVKCVLMRYTFLSLIFTFKFPMENSKIFLKHKFTVSFIPC